MQLGTAVKIHPFTSVIACPKCGEGQHAAELAATVPAFTSAPQFSAQNGPVFTFPIAGDRPMRAAYCPGGKEPEEKSSASGDLIAAFIGTIGEILPAGNLGDVPRKINICAGVDEEHLHRICPNCHFELLMETKDKGGSLPPELEGK